MTKIADAKEKKITLSLSFQKFATPIRRLQNFATKVFFFSKFLTFSEICNFRSDFFCFFVFKSATPASNSVLYIENSAILILYLVYVYVSIKFSLSISIIVDYNSAAVEKNGTGFA